MLDLVHLAAQAQYYRGRDVGVRQHPGQRAPKLFGIRPDGVAATFAVREGHHAIHVGRQRFAVEAARDQLGSMRGAVAGGHHGDIVARAHRAIRARITEKRGSIAARRQRRFARWKFVVELQFLERQVVRVDVLSRLDSLPGAADDLPVAPHDFARMNRAERDLVAGWNGFARDQRPAIDFQCGPGGKRHASDRHVVGGMQMDYGIFRGRQLGNFEQAFE